MLLAAGFLIIPLISAMALAETVTLSPGANIAGLPGLSSSSFGACGLMYLQYRWFGPFRFDGLPITTAAYKDRIADPIYVSS